MSIVPVDFDAYWADLIEPVPDPWANVGRKDK